MTEESKNFVTTWSNAKTVFTTDGLWTKGWGFFRLYYHIVLCIDLFLTSYEEGNYFLGNLQTLWFEVFWDAKRNIDIMYLIFL